MPVEYLKYAIMELTTECNLRCRHCYNWWKQPDAPPRHQNSYKKAFRLLEYLLKKTYAEHITFTGVNPRSANGLWNWCSTRGSTTGG